MNNSVVVRWVGLIFMIVTAAAVSQAAASDFKKPVAYAPIHIDGLKPEMISLERLQNGLLPIYYLEFFERHLDQFPPPGSKKYKAVKGKPILHLNHQFDEHEVFDSGTNRGVAVRMTGYLYIDGPGEYQFQALSNDGVRVALAGKVVISDPEQHSDRLSNIGHAVIDQAGYYPLLVEYFQRKGTAALKLFWKKSPTDEFMPIPQNAYVHLP